MKKTIAGLMCGLVLAGCVAAERPTGRQLFAENCTACHGPQGRGNGWAAVGLSPPPADLTTISARNGGVFPLADVLSSIDGFHRETYDNSLMPQFGLLFREPMTQVDTGDGIMTPVPEPLLAVAEYLETLQVK